MPGGDDVETMQQLLDLGYIERPDVDKPRARRQTQRELDYNLAESLMDAGRFAHAIDILERLWTDWPMEHRFGVRRAGEVPKVDGGADVKPIELDDPNAPKPEDPVLDQDPCEIVVVSSLPRAGTSMMMQMLEAGGLAPLTDGERGRRRQPHGLLRVRARQAADDRSHLAARGRRQGGEDHRPVTAVPAAEAAPVPRHLHGDAAGR